MRYNKIVFSIVVVPTFLIALTRTWINPVGGEWGVGGNWSGRQVPALKDTAIISNVTSGFSINSINLGATQVGRLEVANTASSTLTLSIGASLSISNGSNGILTFSSSNGAEQFIATNLNVNNPLTITQNSGFVQTITGVLTGSGGITKDGSGVLALTQNYIGTTTVSAGTLRLINAAYSGNLVNNSIVELSSGTYSGSMSGAGVLLKTGSSSLTLSNSNAFSGATVVSDGTLIVGKNNALSGTSGVVLSDGAILQLKSGIGLTAVGTLSGSGDIQLNNNTIQVSGGVYSGEISGLGGLTKTSDGVLLLQGAQSYVGPTTVSGGTLRGTTVSLRGNITNNAIVDFRLNIDGTYSGVMSGTGALHKSGSAKLTLTGANTYIGDTVVNAGILVLGNAAALPSASQLVVNGGTVEIPKGLGVTSVLGKVNGGGGTIDLKDNEVEVTDGVYSGNIVGATGKLKKTGSDTMCVLGANTYGGGTTIDGGVLEGTATSLQGAITNNATLRFAQLSDGTFNGTVLGGGTIEKTNGGILTVTGDSSGFSGTTNVSGGKVVVNGALGGQTNLTGGAILKGSGTVDSVNNTSGTVSAGNSIGTLNFTGNYVQGAFATLENEINAAGESDLLNVSGTATLNGTLEVIAAPGVYSSGTQYEFIRTGGGVSGTFSFLVENEPIDFTWAIVGNSVFLTVSSTGVVLPIPLAELTGNAKHVANYLFDCTGVSYSADLTAVINQLVALDQSEFKHALRKLTPAQFGALPRVQLQNSVTIADTFSERVENFSRCVCQDDVERNQSLWVTPVASYQKQDEHGQQLKFDNRMYGAALGYNHLFNDEIILGANAGYTYSDLHWGDSAGKGCWSSVYLAPSIGRVSSNSAVNFLVQAGVDFYDIERKVQFGTVNRTASNTHNSYDLLARFQGSKRFAIVPSQFKNFYAKPEVQVSYLNLWEAGYRESGANSLNLKVDSKYSSFIHSKAVIRLIEEWQIGSTCLSPSVKFGWVGQIALTRSNYTGKLFNETLCSNDFKAFGLNTSMNQLVLGCDLSVSNCWIQFVGDYEAQFFDSHFIQKASLRVEWCF